MDKRGNIEERRGGSIPPYDAYRDLGVAEKVRRKGPDGLCTKVYLQCLEVCSFAHRL